ncbi:putative [Escherichia phage Mu]|uniref:Bacteriophage Mu left end n=1 Tax=Escherichia phage Mu TaxID=2681603 RepID=Q38481_BPMU|nr:putative [Escherichia phage Mu]
MTSAYDYTSCQSPFSTAEARAVMPEYAAAITEPLSGQARNNSSAPSLLPLTGNRARYAATFHGLQGLMRRCIPGP